MDNLIKCIELTVIDALIKRSGNASTRKFLEDLYRVLNIPH